jgi:hypothetical protein
MKKYKLKRIGENEPIGTFDSRFLATQKMEEIINDNNDAYDSYDEEYLIPFDFECVEIEVTDISNEIPDYEAAKRYLNFVPNAKISVNAVNPNHVKALVALNTLFTIAEAWNKADNFVPDFSNSDQYKYFPWFVYDDNAAGFVCAYTYTAATYTAAAVGSRLCFKSANRARQFGKQFVNLWNDLLLFK